MIDPFDFLRDELIRASARHGAPRRIWRPARRPSHPFAIALAICVVGGSAAAAAVSLLGSPSKPLAGTVPGKYHGPSFTFPEAGLRYRVVFAPILNAGQAGWSAAVLVGNYTSQSAGLGFVGGGYPSASTPVIAANSYGFRRGVTPRGKVVDWLLTAGNVAAVRVANQTIQTRTTRDIPAGDRVAVFYGSASSPPIIVPPPGTKLLYYVSAPIVGRHFPTKRTHPTRSAGGQHGFITEHVASLHLRTITPIPLDASGHVVASKPALPSPLSPPILAWSTHPAGPGNPTRIPTHPRSGACELSRHGQPTLTAESGATVEAVEPVAATGGELLLSCNDTEYKFDHWPLTVAILLNAQHPGTAPGPIPGTTPVPGQPGIVVGNGEAARRIGNAWLLVNGGRDLHDQIEVLDALGIAKLAVGRSLPVPAEALAAKARNCLLVSGYQALVGEAPFGPYAYVIDVPSRDVAPPIRSGAEVYIFNSEHAANVGNHAVRSINTNGTNVRFERHGPATIMWYGSPTRSDAAGVTRCLPQ
jgi:hypothetical protein